MQTLFVSIKRLLEIAEDNGIKVENPKETPKREIILAIEEITNRNGFNWHRTTTNPLITKSLKAKW